MLTISSKAEQLLAFQDALHGQFPIELSESGWRKDEEETQLMDSSTSY
jgi:hypothetical protein